MQRACLKGKIDNGKNFRVLSYGCNQMGDDEGIKAGVHAEQDAINKLMPLKYKKSMENINLLVIRISKKNKLQSSKPCNNCIKYMKSVSIKKGYNIKNIYYSMSEEIIVKTTLSKLEIEEQHISRFYRKKDNINNKRYKY